jgi:hypothetical protein
MSIVFLLLVLLISLGVSVYMNSVSSLKEGADGTDSTEVEPEPVDGDAQTEAEGEAPIEAEEETGPVEGDALTEAEVSPINGEESTFDVSPMEGSCTETMTNYK